MAIAFGAHVTGSNGAAANPLVIDSLAVEAGDLLIMQLSDRDATQAVVSVVGSLNGAYTQVGSAQINGNFRADIWYFQNSAAGNEVVTITFAGNIRGVADLSRWTGAATSSALDQNTGTNNASGTAHNCGNIDATAAGVIATAFNFSGEEGAKTHTGFTELTNARGFTRDYFAYRTITGAESNDGDLTCANTVSSVGKIASFLEAGGIDPSLLRRRIAHYRRMQMGVIGYAPGEGDQFES